MSVTKHKIFRVKIFQDDKLSFDQNIQKEINSFLFESDNIYVNHSTSILTEDIEEYGQNKTINKFLIISLIYKDLNDTTYSLKNTSNKVKKVVSKEIETGHILSEPNIETDFDKEVKAIKRRENPTSKLPSV
ncbi:MAG: hypothetical protein LH614_04980 [Pyrinomonadaceae bacterium]|nr:hypothetical protein [Pyrinomonadaceae bacterium]